MIQTTNCFIIRNNKILLGMKKTGQGKGMYNGFGGKAKPKETTEDTLVREVVEEVGVTPTKYRQVTELTFTFEGSTNFDNHSKVFICTGWDGVPKETVEMKPEWFSILDVPYQQMWSSDALWLPKILQGKKVVASIVYDYHNNIVDYQEKEVTTFDQTS